MIPQVDAEVTDCRKTYVIADFYELTRGALASQGRSGKQGNKESEGSKICLQFTDIHSGLPVALPDG